MNQAVIAQQLGGGCASGTLYTVGGGSTRMIVTLIAFIAGSVIATAHMPWWTSLPQLAPMIAAQIDGARNLRDIHGELRKLRADLSWDDFAAQFRLYFAAFHSVGYLMLKLPA